MLEETAEFLGINYADSNGKKLFLKSGLMKRILIKLFSLLPSSCSDCGEVYSVDLRSVALFTCLKCGRGSHDCEGKERFHKSLPACVPKGYVWLCTDCTSEIMPEVPVSDKLQAVGVAPDVDRNESETSGVTSGEVTASDKLPAVGLAADVDRNESGTSGVTSGEVTASDNSFDNGNTQKIQETARKQKVCYLYRKGVCPHGLRGKKLIDGKVCQFPHPRACWKYTAYGGRDKCGCHPGSGCIFFHPILCRHSVKDRNCVNEGCTFVHLKGTKRGKPSLVPNPDQKGTNLVEKAVEQPKNLNGPEEDPLKRLENMIAEIRLSQVTEMTAIKQELGALRSQGLQQSWVPQPQTQWYSPVSHPVQTALYPHQVQPQYHQSI